MHLEAIRHRVVAPAVTLVAALLAAASFVNIGAQAAAVELQVLHCWHPPREHLVDAMLEEFSQAFGVSAKGTLVACGAEAETFLTQFAAGISPDIVMLTTGPTIDIGLKGALLPVDDFMERDGIEDDIWFPGEINNARIFGKTYGLPMRTGGDDGNVLLYNKDHFEESGLPDRAPRTWSEFLEFSRALVRWDGDQLVRTPINALPAGVSQTLYTGGGRIYSDDLRTVAFNAPEALETAEWMHDYLNTIFRGNIRLNSGDQRANWQAEIQSMYLRASFEIFITQQDAPNLRFGFGPRPMRDGLAPRYANNGTYNYAISAQTKHPELAWELLKWLTVRPESAGEFMLVQGRPSALIEFNRDPRFLEINPDFPVLIDILMKAESVPILPLPSHSPTFSQAFTRAVRGEESPSVALENAAQVVQAALDEFWRNQGR